jgi:hypothetical protein
MSPESVRKAIRDAEMFIARAQIVKRQIEMNLYGPSKESGALRRASMELTRSLAEMRKPG